MSFHAYTCRLCSRMETFVFTTPVGFKDVWMFALETPRESGRRVSTEVFQLDIVQLKLNRASVSTVVVFLW